MFFVTLEQVIIMLLLMLVGLLCVKIGFIHEKTVTDMTQVLLYIISPCLILKAFQEDFSQERLILLGKLLLILGITFVANIFIAMLLFNKKTVKNKETCDILRFGASYTNSSFIGIPLAQALNGAMGVFCAVPYLVLFNIFLWTHGTSLFNKNNDAKISHWETLKKVIINPNILASAAGLVFFIGNITFPSIVSDALTYVGNLNTGLSMIVIGTNLALISFRDIITDKMAWLGTIVRNVVFPVIPIILLMLIPLDHVAASTTLIEASCPVAGTAVMFSILNEYDVQFTTRLICLSTVMSVLTIPVIMTVGEMTGI
ncbi:MAG: AEC family transporter [Eubacteriales bacterium]|jgi:predicted permease|nr:AEC family transporter [Eubacteriales bacterium]